MTERRLRWCARALVGVVLVATSGATAPPAMGEASLLAGAGDVSCDPDHKYFNRGYGTGSGYGANAYCKQLATSRLLSGANTVFMLGDSQYEHSSYSNLRKSYARSWGRYLHKTRPAIGNHEYGPGLKCGPTSCSPLLGVRDYFDYFGSRGPLDLPDLLAEGLLSTGTTRTTSVPPGTSSSSTACVGRLVAAAMDLRSTGGWREI